MSEEQNTDKPKPRLLAGSGATGASKPRLLAGSSEGLGKLKLAMKPEQAAAMERVKAERAAANAEEQARLEAETRYTEEQARYEEEKRLYDEYMAAEKLRMEEEARLAAEQQALEAAQAEEARQAVAEQQEAAELQAVQQNTEAQPTPADAPQDSAAMAALAEQQLAAAQELMAKVQALQAIALQQEKTAAVPSVEVAQPATPEPIAIKRPSSPVPMPSIPRPSLSAQTATPAIQPTAALAGAPSLRAGRPSSKKTEEAPVKKPLWKKPILYIPFAIAFIALGAVLFIQKQQRDEEQRIMDRYVAFAKMGADENQTSIAALPEDAVFVLGQIKTDINAWEAAASTLQKMMKGTPSLWPLILGDLKQNYSSYTQNGSAKKLERIVYFVATQKPAPEGLREGMVDFYNFAPSEYKEQLIYQIHPLFKESDIPFLIGIINDSGSSALLKANTERTVSKVMSRATDKAALSKMILDEYNKADDSQKNVYIRLMGKTGNEFGLKFLDGLVNGKDTGNIARRNALKALGTWTNDDSIAVLLKAKDSPYGQAPVSANFVTEELYKNLVTPGRKRDMAKIQPLIDYLKTLNKTQTDKLTFVGHLKGNAKTDQWALDLLKEFLSDSDDKVSYQAEKAMETVNKRTAPETPKPKMDEEPGEK